MAIDSKTELQRRLRPQRTGAIQSNRVSITRPLAFISIIVPAVSLQSVPQLPSPAMRIGRNKAAVRYGPRWLCPQNFGLLLKMDHRPDPMARQSTLVMRSEVISCAVHCARRLPSGPFAHQLRMPAVFTSALDAYTNSLRRRHRAVAVAMPLTARIKPAGHHGRSGSSKPCSRTVPVTSTPRSKSQASTSGLARNCLAIGPAKRSKTAATVQAASSVW